MTEATNLKESKGVCMREALEETRERENYVKDIIISKIKEKCGVMRKKVKQSDL